MINSTSAKAYVAGVLAGLYGAVMYLAPVVDDGVSPSEVLFAVGAFLVGAGVAGGATWTVRNAPESNPRTSTPQPGHGI